MAACGEEESKKNTTNAERPAAARGEWKQKEHKATEKDDSGNGELPPGEHLWRGGPPKKKQKFIYGNYDHYYGYRIGSALEEDPRLRHFKREWFEGKDCLDIGCNEGYVTINTAMRFGVKSALGVDIDAWLISRAWGHLHRYAGTLRRQVGSSGGATSAPAVDAQQNMSNGEEKDNGSGEQTLTFRVGEGAKEGGVGGGEEEREEEEREEGGVERREGEGGRQGRKCKEGRKGGGRGQAGEEEETEKPMDASEPGICRNGGSPFSTEGVAGNGMSSAPASLSSATRVASMGGSTELEEPVEAVHLAASHCVLATADVEIGSPGGRQQESPDGAATCSEPTQEAREALSGEVLPGTGTSGGEARERVGTDKDKVRNGTEAEQGPHEREDTGFCTGEAREKDEARDQIRQRTQAATPGVSERDVPAGMQSGGDHAGGKCGMDEACVSRKGAPAGTTTFLPGSGDQMMGREVEEVTGVSKRGELTGDELRERVRFRKENFVESHVREAGYDVVLCLSVSKWIHLNWGDAGLKLFFGKIFRALRPGGILILEPQPWKSYKNNRGVSKVAKENFTKIEIKPDMFPELLLDKVGFRTMERVSGGIPNSTKGFDRPIFVFHK